MSEFKQNKRPLRPIWRGLPVVLLCLGLSLGAAWQYLRYATPMYESTAKIKLADVNEGAMNTTLIKNLDAFSGTDRSSAEAELVRSPLLLGRALDHLPFDLSTYRVGKLRTTEMYRASPFLVALTLHNPKWAEKPFDLRIDAAGALRLTAPSGEVAEGRLGQPLRLSGAEVTITRNEEELKNRPDVPLADHYRLVQHNRGELIEAIGSQLDVSSTDRNVPVLRISYQSPVPEKAADLVNALTAVYLDDYLATKYKVVNATSQSITEQLKTVRRTLSHSEDTVEQYRDKKSIVNIKQETETDLHKIAELKIQRANIQMSLAAANNLYRYMTNGKNHALALAPNFEAFNDMLSTDIIKKIKDLQAEKHDLLLRFTPEDAQVKTVDLKLADLNSYLLESIRNTRTSLTIRYRDIDRTIRQSQGVFVGLPTREKNLAILERDFQLNEKLYTFLREKETEAEIAKATPISYHRVIADGLVPTEPTAPHRGFVLLVSGFLGLLVGSLLAYLIAGVRSTPGDAYSVQKEAATPLAATIPHLGEDFEGQLAFFKQLATRLALKGFFVPGNKLVVSAFTDKEGQSFFFEHLRQALVAQGLKVRALVLRDPTSPNPDAQPDELLLVQNLPLAQDSYALAVMAGAQANLFVIDSRTTPTFRLAELDLLVADYQLPNVHLCLNRDGYDPGFLRIMARRLRRSTRRAPQTAAEPTGLPLPAGLDLQA
ncbi:GumC family protein [Hymenobacter terricola]|uniref:GumC family protein n=1 Tax=Hymenobacter terricola TaxID=2819236 RepID=UPI001B316A43|nr:GNVR domain-containing protein [Hymenobacter terricola]